MPHQIHLRKLGRRADHRLAVLRNLAVSVLRYERVRTTEAKAKEVRRVIDRIISLGRDGSLAARRRALALAHDRLIVEKVFSDLAERYAGRASGYTRLVRLGHRVGDGAPLMLVELVEGAEPAPPKEASAPPAREAEVPPAQGGVARAREIARRVTGAASRAAKPAAKPAAQKPAAKPAEEKKPTRKGGGKAEKKGAARRSGEAKKPAPRRAKKEKE